MKQVPSRTEVAPESGNIPSSPDTRVDVPQIEAPRDDQIPPRIWPPVNGPAGYPAVFAEPRRSLASVTPSSECSEELSVTHHRDRRA
jgi:hypothetical protein